MNKRSKHIVWHPSPTTDEDRRAMLGQSGCVLWMTGLSGSGKSTLAHAVERKLLEQGHFAYVLDGDNIRHRLNRDLGFSAEDRDENIRRIAEVARLFAECGIVCITAFISPFRDARSRARDIIGTDRFLEIYISTSLETCEQRDPKGLYKKVRAGEIEEFTGINSPFEPPESPDLSVDTAQDSTEASIESVLRLLCEKNYLELNSASRETPPDS